MLAWHKLRDKQTGEEQFVAALDGIDETSFDVIPIVADRAPGEFQTVDDSGQTATDMDKVQAAALEQIDRAQREAMGQFQDLVAAISVIETWSDIKRGERDIEQGTVPATPDGINERYPFLAAIAEAAQIDIGTALRLAKAEMWPQMVDVARFAARATLARRDVRNASSVAAVQAAAQVDVTG